MEQSLQSCLSELLRRADDHLPGLNLAEDDKTLLRGKLLTILVDHDEFRVYLRELLASALQISSAGCRHNTPLPADRLEALLVSGPSILTDRELATLMLNPMALSIAQAALDARMSDGPDAPLADEWSAAEEQAIERAGINLKSRVPTTLLENLKKNRPASDPKGAHDREATAPPLTETRVPQRGVIPFPGPTTGRFRLRQISYGMAVAVAASLLIGVGVLIGKIVFQGGPRTTEEVLLAAVEPQARLERDETQALRRDKEGVYSLDPKARFQVSIQSPRNGFATIVLLAPGVTQVRPEAGQDDLTVEAFKGRTYGPIIPPPGKFTVLVVVTPTPATEAVKKALPEAGCSPDRAGDVLEAVQQRLWKAGVPWAAVNRVTVERGAKD